MTLDGLPSAWNFTEGIKLMLYGQSGTGKTVFWSTFPGPILAMICSGGSRPGELKSIDTPECRAKITAVIVSDTKQLKNLLEVHAAKFRTLVIDHVSGLQDLTLKEILGVSELPAQKGWGLATQAQWGQSVAQCKEYLRAMLSHSGNTVIIGQERTFGGKDEGMDPDLIRPTVGVAVTPQLAGWLNPACDYVLQMFKRPKYVTNQVVAIQGQPPTDIRERVRGVEYCARCEAHDVFTTKFRRPVHLGEIPDVIVNPTYDKVMEVIRGVKPKQQGR
jgi:hypothetical protein